MHSLTQKIELDDKQRSTI